MYGGKLRLVMTLEKERLKFSSFSIKIILSFLAILPEKSGLRELLNLLLSHNVTGVNERLPGSEAWPLNDASLKTFYLKNFYRPYNELFLVLAKKKLSSLL